MSSYLRHKSSIYTMAVGRSRSRRKEETTTHEVVESGLHARWAVWRLELISRTGLLAPHCPIHSNPPTTLLSLSNDRILAALLPFSISLSHRSQAMPMELHTAPSASPQNDAACRPYGRGSADPRPCSSDFHLALKTGKPETAWAGCGHSCRGAPTRASLPASV